MIIIDKIRGNERTNLVFKVLRFNWTHCEPFQGGDPGGPPSSASANTTFHSLLNFTVKAVDPGRTTTEKTGQECAVARGEVGRDSDNPSGSDQWPRQRIEIRRASIGQHRRPTASK
ncbi:hypothetical protein NKR23_g6917 [Pleurostoma richardsiae]|uniref:Uncharacterized protein n=1 Tax=Pleurostoma richardsiae TaxID=41990 RepID=A0AA38RPM6_9PEZI|nr:hypothetical protein NKR23_g6917 [Pleurostoma richardsiae]